jgi:hypothetical protein
MSGRECSLNGKLKRGLGNENAGYKTAAWGSQSTLFSPDLRLHPDWPDRSPWYVKVNSQTELLK